MNLARQVALKARSLLTRPIRYRRMKRHCAQGTAPMNVLFYHRVADTHPNDWTISRSGFRRHVEFCRDNFEMVDLAAVQSRLETGRNDRPTVTFTFDDGYAENSDFAFPLILEKKVPTTYFVATEHVLRQTPFEHDVASGSPLPVNTKQQIREASDAGIEIGHHTKNHVDFSNIRDAKTIRDEIVHGKQDLEDMIGRPVRYFAVPFGLPRQLHPVVIDTIHEAGFDGFCSAFGAYNVPGNDSFHLRRFHGDPEFARLENWLSFDPKKTKNEPNVPTARRGEALDENKRNEADRGGVSMPPIRVAPSMASSALDSGVSR
ncbi:MAG: polysaccharide deacetylase family protein [Planctomycetota bacterium]